MSLTRSTLFMLATLATSQAELAPRDQLEGEWKHQIETIFEDHCYDCHGDGVKKGGVTLDEFTNIASMQARRKTWKAVRQQIAQGVMPPSDEPQPSEGQRAALLAWIDAAIFPVDPDNPDPGSITIRRLNQAEYKHTMNDLLGHVKLNVSNVLPPDDSGHGFDNMSDVLSLAPSHLQKFHKLARKALGQVIIQNPKNSSKLSYTHKRLFPPRKKNEPDGDYSRRVISRFMRRAFRRDIDSAEVERYLTLVDKARPSTPSLEAAISTAFEAILISPHFLFRELELLEATSAGAVTPVPETVLASRLSYFIWSSAPDDELLNLASQGRLRGNLDQQIQRMLADPRAPQRLAHHFLGQWFQTRDVRLHPPSGKQFKPYFDVVSDVTKETKKFLEHLVSADRPFTDLIDADYTFLNEPLARYYNIPGLEGKGKAFRKVTLPPESRRKGILTHSSVLVITSNPTRTSPVKRGKWVLENILGTPPPDAPPNVPSLINKKSHRKKLSVRERLEIHRQDPSCASCHKLMDGIGFAFENYDAVGRWRDKDGTDLIDAKGSLASGESFVGAQQLTELILREQRQLFVECVSKKMLTYALGRGLEYYDKTAIEQISLRANREGLTFSSFVKAVVHSTPFQCYKK